MNLSVAFLTTSGEGAVFQSSWYAALGCLGALGLFPTNLLRLVDSLQCFPSLHTQDSSP
jgi:hypothetical protein